MTEPVGIAVIGTGDWGANLIRNFASLPGARLAALCDSDPKRLAASAARYLEECLPRAEYWDVPVAEQTEAVAPLRIMEFLDQASAAVDGLILQVKPMNGA